MLTPAKKLKGETIAPSPVKAKPCKAFCLSQPPDPQSHFYISTDSDIAELISHLNPQDLVLVRGPPSTGKSTIAEAICRRHPYDKKSKERSFVFLGAQALEEVLMTKDSNKITTKIISILNDKSNLDDALEDVKDLTAAFSWLIQNNVAVVVDEAHMIFNTASDEKLKYICSAFLKHPQKMTAVFFSTTSETVATSGHLSHSPGDISKKFFWAGQFEVEGLEEQLKDAGVRLSIAAITALAHISGLHRGVFVRLCEWVEKQQSTIEVIVAPLARFVAFGGKCCHVLSVLCRSGTR